MVDMVAGHFVSGGPFMWVLLGVLAVAAAVIVERVISYLFFLRVNTRALTLSVTSAIQNDNDAELQNITSKGNSPAHRLIRAGVGRYLSERKISRVEAGIEEAAIKEIPRFFKRLSYLSLFANVATLLGLLGTIAGLQVSFSSLANVDAAQKAAMLASGISQAMNTTAFGLIVAVPCMIAYTMLNNQQQSLVRDLDEALAKVVNAMRVKVEA